MALTVQNLEELTSILCLYNYALEQRLEELDPIVCFDNTVIDPSPLCANQLDSAFAPAKTLGSDTHLEGTAGVIPKVLPEIYGHINNKQTIDGDPAV